MREVRPDTPALVGTGVVTALGFGTAAHRDALLAGRSGIRATDDADPSTGMGLAALVDEPRLRAEVPDALQAQIKFLNGAGELAAEVGREAWLCAGWEGDEDRVPPERRGLWLSQMDSWDWSCPEMQTSFQEATEHFTLPLEAEALNRASVRHTKPFFLLESLKNNAFSFLSAWYGLQGANTGVAGFAGGTLGLLDLAARAVTRGSVDRALVVAAGRAANPIARRDAVFHGLTLPDADPAFRPLDVNGRGLVLGEGAAALTLERQADLQERGAEPLAHLLGYGGATGEPLDAGLAPTAETIRLAVAGALEDAQVKAGDLLGVVLPARGLPAPDRAMLDALDGFSVLERVPAVSWRGATGHAGLADDLVDLVLAVQALQDGVLPGTVGAETPLSRRVARDAVRGEAPAVLVVGIGLQGQASAVVAARSPRA